MTIDTKKIKEVIVLFEESNLARLDLEVEGMKIGMEKPKQEISYISSPASQIPASNISPVEEKPEVKQTGEAIKSPLVGIYYAAPGIGEAPFVEEGSTVKKGDILCIVEAMKVMNEIKASKDGKISSIMAKNGETIQFDDVLMYIV